VLFDDLVGFGGSDVEQPISASSELAEAKREESVAYGRHEEDRLGR
jgi:hypothetical protein